jgi:hypothetical protein
MKVRTSLTKETNEMHMVDHTATLEQLIMKLEWVSLSNLQRYYYCTDYWIASNSDTTGVTFRPLILLEYYCSVILLWGTSHVDIGDI